MSTPLSTVAMGLLEDEVLEVEGCRHIFPDPRWIDRDLLLHSSALERQLQAVMPGVTLQGTRRFQVMVSAGRDRSGPGRDAATAPCRRLADACARNRRGRGAQGCARTVGGLSHVR